MSLNRRRIFYGFLFYFVVVFAALLITNGNFLSVGIGMLLFNVIAAGAFSFIIPKKSLAKKYARWYAIISSLLSLALIVYGIFLYSFYLSGSELFGVGIAIFFGVIITGFLSYIAFLTYASKFEK